MTSIPVPESYQAGVDALVRINDGQYLQLLSALKSAEPAMFSAGLTSQVAPALDGVKTSAVQQIVEALVVMYGVRARAGMAASEFANGIRNGVDDFEGVEFSEDDKNRLEERLTDLLEIEKSIGITAKASGVISEHEHTFCSVRVITDVRPIYKDDLSLSPSEAVVIHTLKIGYHKDRDHKDFFVAMDDEDIQKLKVAIERAELKSKSAKSMLKKADVLCLDVE